jgi:hypothetical protein
MNPFDYYQLPTLEQLCPPRAPEDMPAYPRIVHTDFSVETIMRAFITGGPRSAALLTDEGALMFHGHNLKGDTAGASLAALVKLYDNGQGERLRQSDIEGSGSFHGAAFTASISCQPVAAKQALSDDLMMGQGFLARFLLAHPKPRAGQRFETKESLSKDPSADRRICQYWNRVRELAFKPPRFDEYGGLRRELMPLSDDALEVWLTCYNAYEKEQAKGGKYAEKLKPFAGRFGENSLRVATVLAAFDGHTEINAEVMANAIRIVAYSLGQWWQTMEGAETDQTTANASSLLEWLKVNPEQRTLVAVYQKSPRRCQCRTKQKAQIALAHLRDLDWIRTSDGLKTFRVWGDGNA